MKHGLALLLSAFCLSMISSCVSSDCGDKGSIILPIDPLNLAALNSPYDDWNCAAPWSDWESNHSLFFSSSRKSQGRQFDLILEQLWLKGENDIQAELGHGYYPLKRIAEMINTEKDELGPSFWYSGRTTQSNQVKPGAAFVFSRGDAPDHDLMALMPEDSSHSSNVYSFDSDSLVEINLRVLNTPQDEGYLTWTEEFGSMLFHSNRDGKYRIYQATVPLDSNGPYAWLRNPRMEGVVISKVEALASMDGEERCPLLVGNRLYFVSDREGGQGGFDIYRSTWSNGSWSPPENLGSRINSPSNEYRPHGVHINRPGTDPAGPDAVIFSSDRPGGLGGYDLHLAALPESK